MNMVMSLFNKIIQAMDARQLSGVSCALLIFLSGTVWAAGPAHYQTANMHLFSDSSVDIPGAATLLRKHQELWLRIHTTELDAVAAYTVWWVIFNNPRACSGECGGDDLGDPKVAAAIFYATSFISGADGTGNAVGHLRSGKLPNGIETIDLGNGAPARLASGNGYRAEVHVIIRSHGSVMAGYADIQLGSGDFAETIPGCCADQQAAAFLPVR